MPGHLVTRSPGHLVCKRRFDRFDRFCQPLGLNLALPKDEHSPAHLLEFGSVALVALSVALELLGPIGGVGGGGAVAGAGRAAVPEAAVDEDRELVFVEDDVGRAGELANVSCDSL